MKNQMGPLTQRDGRDKSLRGVKALKCRIQISISSLQAIKPPARLKLVFVLQIKHSKMNRQKNSGLIYIPIVHSVCSTPQHSQL